MIGRVNSDTWLAWMRSAVVDPVAIRTGSGRIDPTPIVTSPTIVAGASELARCC